MMRLDSDLIDLFNATIDGVLDKTTANWSDDTALGIVMAAGNYPAGGSRGEVIQGLEAADATGVKVFHAGTSLDDDGKVVTAGGRVLCVTSRANTIEKAKTQAEEAAKKISWPNVHWRTDIGYRAVDRANSS